MRADHGRARRVRVCVARGAKTAESAGRKQGEQGPPIFSPAAEHNTNIFARTALIKVLSTSTSTTLVVVERRCTLPLTGHSHDTPPIWG